MISLLFAYLQGTKDKHIFTSFKSLTLPLGRRQNHRELVFCTMMRLTTYTNFNHIHKLICLSKMVFCLLCILLHYRLDTAHKPLRFLIIIN